VKGLTPVIKRLILVSVASLSVLSAMMWMADYWGISRGWINGFFLVSSIVGYAAIGIICRTANPIEYFVAGRRISAPFNGMATAADWMSAASFIGLTGLLLADGFLGNGHGAGGLAYLLGWTGGFCLLGFLFAAKLNASQAITLPDFLGRRFHSLTVRWLAAWGAVVCSSIYLVAQIYGIGLVASMLSGLTFELGVFLALGGILMCSFLGGMRAITWTQVVQSLVIVFSMFALAVAVSWKTHGHPVIAVAASQSLETIQARSQQIESDPQETMTREEIALRIHEIDTKIADPEAALQIERERISREIARAKQEGQPFREIQHLEAATAWRAGSVDDLLKDWLIEREQLVQSLDRPVGFQTHGLYGLNQGWVNSLALVICFMLGTAALPHILVRSYTASSPRDAEVSVVWALVMIVLVYLCASSLAVLMKSFVLTELVGADFNHLPEWAERLRVKKMALLTLTDYNGDGVVQFADIRLYSDYIMLAIPDIARLSPVFVGLIAAGALAAALSTADGLLLTISNAFAEDMFFPTASYQISPLKRVMLSKVLLMVVALVAAWFAANRQIHILFWVTCAFSMAASTFFPVLTLSLYWKGMTRSGAIAAMLVGFSVAMFYILANHPWIQVSLKIHPSSTLWWGLDPTCAGIFGVPAGFLAGILVSIWRKDQNSL
jgi:cation/acetate symporter